MRVGCGCRRHVKQSSFLGCDVGQQGGGREEGGGREGGPLTGLTALPAGWWWLAVSGGGGVAQGRGGCGLPCPARHTL